MADCIRLNIGAGDTSIPGFISLDIKTGTDVTAPLPYANGSVEEVYCSHMLEHLHHTQVFGVLADMVRVLKPGGRIRIAVPDFDRILADYAAGKMSPFMLSAWMHGSHNDDTDRHRAVTTFDTMSSMLRRLGIDRLERWEPEYQDCSRVPYSLNLGGYKRIVTIKDKPKVAMVLSTGRFGPIDLYHGVAELCRTQGWPLVQWGGDNWAKALTCCVDKAIAVHDPDYILTLDFDSWVPHDDVLRMFKFMQEHPEIAAMWPVQAHRHLDVPLGMALDGAAHGLYDFSKTNPWGGEFTQYGSGHFGCTFIRRQVFDTLPRPWLQGIPDIRTGDWNDVSLDNDISFWVNAMAHGFIFGQMNSVQIPHLELAAKIVDGDKTAWVPIQYLRKHGIPPWAKFDGEAWVRRIKKSKNMADDPIDSTKVSAQLAELNREIEQKMFPTQSASVTQPGAVGCTQPQPERQANG